MEDAPDKEKENLMHALIQQYTGAPFIINIFEHAIERFAGNSLEGERSQLLHILLFDGLLSLLLGLFCKHCDLEGKTELKEEDVKKLLLILAHAIGSCNRKLK